MSYLALARKWRPKRFSDLVGQGHVVRTLGNALASGKIHHAHLFAGARGVGKTTVARIWAKCLNCERAQNADPCGECDTCLAIDAGNYIDLIEVDAASRTGVDETRALLETVRYPPAQGRCKVYLFDEAHMFSTGSFNALLKTLEEPPASVNFVLATTDPGKVPATVLSRCLQFNLRLLEHDEIAARLRAVFAGEGVDFEEPAVGMLARAAAGSLRDGLSLADQAVAYGGGKVAEDQVREMLSIADRRLLMDVLAALAEQDVERTLACVAAITASSTDYAGTLAAVLEGLHQIALLQLAPEAAARTFAGDPHQAEYQALAEKLGAEEAQLFYQMGLLGQRDLPLAPNGKVGLEMALLRMLVFVPDAQSAPARPAERTGKAEETGRAQEQAVEMARAEDTGSADETAPAPARRELADANADAASAVQPPKSLAQSGAQRHGDLLRAVDGLAGMQVLREMGGRLVESSVRRIGTGPASSP